MLFLLNDTVLDLGAPADTLASVGGPPLTRARLDAAVKAGQEAIYAAGAFSAAHLDVSLRVACEIAVSSEANAALFVRPHNARSPAQVAVRLVSAPLTTLVAIQQRQARHGADPGFINANVWNLAAALLPA